MHTLRVLEKLVPDFRYSAEISGWRVPQLSIDHYSTAGREFRGIDLSVQLYALSLLTLELRDNAEGSGRLRPYTH